MCINRLIITNRERCLWKELKLGCGTICRVLGGKEGSDAGKQGEKGYGGGVRISMEREHLLGYKK